MLNTIENPQAKGLHPLGEKEIEVKIFLTEEDKIDLGKAQSAALMSKMDLEIRKKKVTDDFKKQIHQQELIAYVSAKTIRDGFRMENNICDCFVDFQHEKRIYINKTTGEILKEEPIHPEDRQLKMWP